MILRVISIEKTVPRGDAKRRLFLQRHKRHKCTVPSRNEEHPKAKSRKQIAFLWFAREQKAKTLT